MRGWIEELSDWMEEKEEAVADPSLVALSEEMDRTVSEAHSFLEASDKILFAYSHIMENAESDDGTA